jgi:hypothetical protein
MRLALNLTILSVMIYPTYQLIGRKYSLHLRASIPTYHLVGSS